MFDDGNFCTSKGIKCSYADSFGNCSRSFSGCVRDSLGCGGERHYCSAERHECEFATAMGDCTKSVCDNLHPAHKAAILKMMYDETNKWFDK